MPEELLKKEADRLMQIKGNVRGEVFLANAAYIRFKKGEDEIKAVEVKLKELGYPLNFKEINPGEWYLEALSVLSILAARDIFNWKESDIFEMGYSVPKYSFISKIFINYFLSLKRFIREVPKYWGKHFDFGGLEVSELNEEKNYLILQEKGYKFHPVLCVYHAGYYLRIAKFVIKGGKSSIEETKCVFKGDPYHEYIIKW